MRTRKRKLDYNAIKELRLEGFGYKRIAKALDYNMHSTKDAVERVDRENNIVFTRKVSLSIKPKPRLPKEPVARESALLRKLQSLGCTTQSIFAN